MSSSKENLGLEGRAASPVVGTGSQEHGVEGHNAASQIGANGGHHVGLQGHNSSSQVGVDRNPDPALDYANEHRHGHPHHHGAAAKSLEKHDEVMYSSGTTEKGHDLMDRPLQDYSTHKLNDATIEKSIDEESGNVGAIRDGEDGVPTNGRYRRYYRKIRPFIPIAIWMVFTA
jgi:CNT family concentrative nucleoside transporter